MLTRYYYLRDKNRAPVVSFKTGIDRDANTIVYAFAILNPKDQFMKHIARTIVNARFDMKPITLDNVPLSGHEISMRVISSFLSQDIPKRIRKLAERWMVEARKPRPERDTLPILPTRRETLLPAPPMRA